MKNLLVLVAFSAMAMMSFSCSKGQVNEAKLTIAEKAGQASAKLLKDEYNKKPELATQLCSDEADKIGSNVQHEIERFLKAQPSDALNKSVSSDILQLACKGMMAQVLPLVFGSQFQGYPCAKVAVSDKLGSLGDELCQKIKL